MSVMPQSVLGGAAVMMFASILISCLLYTSMVPTFGKKAMLGSNPIAVAMPAEPYPFLFDCSTTVVTRGKLEMYNKMGKELPHGWALVLSCPSLPSAHP